MNYVLLVLALLCFLWEPVKTWFKADTPKTSHESYMESQRKKFRIRMTFAFFFIILALGMAFLFNWVNQGVATDAAHHWSSAPIAFTGVFFLFTALGFFISLIDG